MPRLFCGIDPGYDGALAFIDEKREVVLLMDMPVLKVSKSKRLLNEGMLFEVFSKYMPCFVAIEKAQTMPKQGIASAGHYLEGYGFIRGLLRGLSIPYQEVPPQRWKKEMMFGAPKEKSASILIAERFYPAVGFTRKKDHGQADALLIATWGYKHQTYTNIGSTDHMKMIKQVDNG